MNLLRSHAVVLTQCSVTLVPFPGQTAVPERGLSESPSARPVPSPCIGECHFASVAREERGSKFMNHGSVYVLVAEAKYLLL